MSANLNKVMLIGYLGADPEKRFTPSGVSVVAVNIATSSQYKDSNEQTVTKTEWHKLVFWRKLADILASYTKKGSLIYVEGRLQTREWQDKDAQKRYTTEIVVERLQLLDRKGEKTTEQGSSINQGSHFAQTPEPPSDISTSPDDLDDLPF